jgi:hypothetical protein
VILKSPFLYFERSGGLPLYVRRYPLPWPGSGQGSIKGKDNLRLLKEFDASLSASRERREFAPFFLSQFDFPTGFGYWQYPPTGNTTIWSAMCK